METWTAALCLKRRDTGASIRKKLMVYPFVDYTLSYPSIDELGEGFIITKKHQNGSV